MKNGPLVAARREKEDVMQDKKTLKGLRRALGSGLFATLLGVVAGLGVVPSAQAAEGELKPCIECHESVFEIADTRHFVENDARTPRPNGLECMACHGDPEEHNKKPRTKGLVPVPYGKKAEALPQNEKCLACHQSGTRIHWQGSAHDRAKVACASCHKAHGTKDAVLVPETQAGVCFECHKNQRAEMLKLSTHAAKNGFFSCSSCHQSHGSSSRALMAKNSVNETCYTCHADKRGPFLWEHRSAQDDCANCHNPHGTNNAPMLKTRMPYLCQQCHQTTTGHATTKYDSAAIASNNQRAVGRACANCHTKVHGTNHPSGARLQR